MAAPLITIDARKEAWLKDRRTAITGTDVACILGLSKWGSGISVWLDKRGEAEPFVDTEATRWGRRLERSILEGYSDVSGEPIEFADSYQLIRVPGFNLLGASLDARRLQSDRRPVDAKNIRSKSIEYGEPGSDTIPPYYATQLVVQMMATETQSADLAVLFSGQEFAAYTIHRDSDVDAVIQQRVHDWWQRHIIQGIQPAPDGSDSATKYLAKKFARGIEKTLEATDQVREWVAQRQEAVEKEKAAKTAKTQAENLIKDFMGEATYVKGLLSWKNNRDTPGTDIEKAFYTLCQDQGIDSEAYLSKFPTLTQGARVLRFLTAR
jgi:putative phage-type endonuclease